MNRFWGWVLARTLRATQPKSLCEKCKKRNRVYFDWDGSVWRCVECGRETDFVVSDDLRESVLYPRYTWDVYFERARRGIKATVS